MQALQKARSILIVDDEERLRKSLRRSLLQENYATLTAASEAEALRILDENRIDLVITDLFMPGMGGMALIRRIKSLLPAIKIVIITAYGSAASVREAEELGVDGYLTKPFDLAGLRAKVNELLAGGTSAPPRRERHAHMCCLCFVCCKMLGAASGLSRRGLGRIHPMSIMRGLGRVTKAVCRLALVFRRRHSSDDTSDRGAEHHSPRCVGHHRVVG